MIIRVPVSIAIGEPKSEFVLAAVQSDEKFDHDEVAKAIAYTLGNHCAIAVLESLTKELTELMEAVKRGQLEAIEHLDNIKSYAKAFEVE